MSKKYEAVILLDDQKHQDGGEAFVASLTSAIAELGGTIDKNESMGRRQLAYAIRKKTTGVYWHTFLQMTPDKIAPLKERYHLDQSILRFEIFINDRPERYSLKPDLPADASPTLDGPTPPTTGDPSSAPGSAAPPRAATSAKPAAAAAPAAAPPAADAAPAAAPAEPAAAEPTPETPADS